MAHRQNMGINTSPPLLRFRRTKIVATIGPASSSESAIRALIEAGTNVFRLNMSHGDHGSHRAALMKIRELADLLDRPIAVFADLAGPKIRTGKFQNGGIELKDGAKVSVTVEDVLGTTETIPSQYPNLCKDVMPGQRLLLADGLIELRADSIEDPEIRCTVIHGGPLSDRKGINLPESQISAPSLTEKDKLDAAFALEMGVDFLALSFVRKAEDVEALRSLIRSTGQETGIISKIEKPEALRFADEIVSASDAVMVARGDLGVEVPAEQVPSAQLQLIDLARHHQKPVIVATQMLESMIGNPRPTRAEVSDVATAIKDGADAVMLSGETAVSPHAKAAVSMMDRIARQTEAHLWQRSRFASLERARKPDPSENIAAAFGSTVAELSRALSVRAVVVLSKSGFTARAMTAARPAAPVVVLCDNAETRRRTQLAWGVIRVYSQGPDKVGRAREVVQSLGLAVRGQSILLVSGFHVDRRQNLPSVTWVEV